MERLLVVAVVVVVAGIIALVARRAGAADAPATGGTYHVPSAVDRSDFPRPDTPWLVVVFTSATCDTCAGVVEKARALDSDEVAVTETEVSAQPELHRRYGIDAVPAVVIADEAGTTRRSFLGPTSAADLWSAVAELRA